MATTTNPSKVLITGVFRNSDDAAQAVAALVDGGIPRDDINIVLPQDANLEAFGIKKQTKVGEGAALGGTIGGAVGALVLGFTAVGAIATGGASLLISGPLIAALAGAGAGAAAGGLVGGLIGLGIPEHEIKYYKEALESGSVLVGVHAPESRREWVEQTLTMYHAVDPSELAKTPKTTSDVSGSRKSRTGIFGGNGDAEDAEMESNGLHQIFVEQLKDIYYAENQLVDALGEMRDAASNPELRTAFADHLHETEYHVRRLEQVFESIGTRPKQEKCPAINGIITEAKDLMKMYDESPQRDAALICGAQKAEHYEMATYGCLAAYARTMGHTTAFELLSQTLQEETAADKLLTSIAESGVNQSAGTPVGAR